MSEKESMTVIEMVCVGAGVALQGLLVVWAGGRKVGKVEQEQETMKRDLERQDEDIKAVHGLFFTQDGEQRVVSFKQLAHIRSECQKGLQAEISHTRELVETGNQGVKDLTGTVGEMAKQLAVLADRVGSK